MIFSCFTSLTLVISLLALPLAASPGSCMPCQHSNRRDTPWDRRQTIRGVSYNLRITNPTNNTMWTPGSDVVVTWDARDMPDENSNQKGMLLLGYLEDGSDNEHLNIKHPLASDVNLHDGFTTFKCTKVEPREDYIVVLFGDSGNRSPTFTIKK